MILEQLCLALGCKKTFAEIGWISCNHNKAKVELFSRRILVKAHTNFAHEVLCFNGKTSAYYVSWIFIYVCVTDNYFSDK